jgi:hypothetical protein
MPRRFNGSIPRPQSRRFRVSVPDADESVLEWIGAQSDLSASVRALIRDAIERNGYRDATCYPVQQQPRRGRPPKQAEQVDQAEQSEQFVTIDGHQIAAQSIGILMPKAELDRELLMVPASHDGELDETVEVLPESDVADESVESDDSDNTADAKTGSAHENAIEDMLGALR